MIRPCPVCKNSAELFIQAQDLNQKVGTAVFDYYRCPGCTLVFLDPVPADLGRYYDVDYPPYRIPATQEQLAQAAGAVAWRVDFVRQYATAGRLLEIGPSYGAFAYVASKTGFTVDVIEMDEQCCAFINQHIPEVTALQTTNPAEGIVRLGRQYDVITLWHNIEHLTDPWAVLGTAVQHLAHGGVLVISTPNPDSLQFRLFRKNWVHLDAPRHLLLLPPRVLTQFLVGHGMTLEHVTTSDPDSRLMTEGGWGQSIGHAIAGYGAGRRVIKRLLKMVRAVLWPLERLLGRGAGYTAVYRKTGRRP